MIPPTERFGSNLVPTLLNCNSDTPGSYQYARHVKRNKRHSRGMTGCLEGLVEYTNTDRLNPRPTSMARHRPSLNPISCNCAYFYAPSSLPSGNQNHRRRHVHDMHLVRRRVRGAMIFIVLHGNESDNTPPHFRQGPAEPQVKQRCHGPSCAVLASSSISTPSKWPPGRSIRNSQRSPKEREIPVFRSGT